MDNSNHEEDKRAVYISYDNNDSSISSFIKFLTPTFNHHGVYQPVEKSHRLSNLITVLVVVFSRNYTFSLPNNLVSRLNKKDRTVVVPVLYGVTVSSVKEQIPVLEPRARALLESVVFPGHVYNEEQSEFKFMEEIARDVFEKLYPTKEIGIHRLQLDIENLLCKQPWGVRTLGISGEPGIGKTTLAKALFRRMSSGYDASCFINDYNEKRLQHLSNEYMDEIPMEEIKFSLIKSISTPSHRKKRVLIVLDDVQNDNDVKSFLGGEFGPGSLIILTSRYKQVLEKCKVNEIYELQGLNQEDAMKLFTRCAFGKDVTEQNLLKCSMKEIEDANGNPLTICSNAIRRKNELSLQNSHEGMSSTSQESPRCDIENNTSMRIIPNEEEDEPGVNIELPSFHDTRLVRFMKDFVNSISQIIMLMKNTVSINKNYFIYIMVSVFGCLWYFLGYWEGSEFFKQTIIFLVLVNYTVIFFL